MNPHIRLLLIFALFLGSCKTTKVITAQPDEATGQDSVSTAPPEKAGFKTETDPYHPSKTLQQDLIHTKLEVSFDWQKHQLNGVATLELRPYFYPQDTLVLDAKNFDIHSIALLADNESRPLNYTYDGKKISIALGKSFTSEENYFVKIDYTAKPEEGKSQGSAAITDDQGLYFIGTDTTSVFGKKPQQIWTQGETQANSHWFPTIDTPNERCTQEIFITVDNKFKTLSNGVLVYSQMENDSTRTDYWQMDQPHAPYLFMMAIGEYAIVKDRWNNIPVDYYVEPAYEPYAKDIFGNTPEMLQFFSDKLGINYPWPKYSQVVVRDFVSGAMENTTASTFMEALQVDDRELLDYNWDGIIAHELFHHWFGDLVTCESWSNLPLNESFASYAEYLWSEYKYGKDEADYGLWEQGQNYFQEAQTKQVDLIRFHYHDKEDMFDRTSYDKGSRVLHMLRNVVGDRAFFTALNRYLKKHAYQSVEIHDLRLAFEEVTGQDMNWFFNQWLLSSGYPQLEIDQQYRNGKLLLTIRQTQDPDSTPVYRLPVKFDVWHQNEKQQFTAEISTPETQLSFDVATAPDVVIFDPEGALLAKVSFEKSAAQQALQFQKSDNFIRQYEGLMAFAEDSTVALQDKKQILSEALRNDYWIIRQYAINALAESPEALDAAMLTQLEEIAQKDLKSLVRADAITALASIDSQQYAEVFRQGLSDLSYAVNGASIAAYAQTTNTDKAALFDPFADKNNVNIAIALADYYVSDQVTDKYTWFEQKLTALDNESLYYLINYFARYLMMADPANKDKGIQLIAEYARHHPKYYIRLAAYRSLGLFDDVKGVEALRKKIKNAETNENLKALYQNIP